MLQPAAEELKAELNKVQWNPLRVPYVTNVHAGIVDDIAETAELLTRQLISPVRWMQSMETMIAGGVTTFVEIGPGKTLAGFLRKISREAKVINIASWEDLERLGEIE